MRAQRARRLFAVSAAGLMMAGGIAIGTAGTASANDSSHHDRHGSYSRYCDDHHNRWWNDDYCNWGRYDRGHDRYDNGRYDHGRFDNGRYDHGRFDNGRFDNGRGHDNGRGGHDNGHGGHDNGRGGHDNGRGGHDGGRGGR